MEVLLYNATKEANDFDFTLLQGLGKALDSEIKSGEVYRVQWEDGQARVQEKPQKDKGKGKAAAVGVLEGSKDTAAQKQMAIEAAVKEAAGVVMRKATLKQKEIAQRGNIVENPVAVKEKKKVCLGFIVNFWPSQFD